MNVRVCVYGAGSIGCYVGGRLAAAGVGVEVVGRKRMADEVAETGLRLTDLRGADERVPPSGMRYVTEPVDVEGAGLVLITVKSAATATAAAQLAEVLPTDAVVVSFQNGLRSGDALRRELPGRTVLEGMVQFNVVHQEPGHFHAGTDGGLEVRGHPALAPYLQAFERAGLPLQQHDDMASVQWAKLLLNLNNAVNALSGLPLREQLSQRPYRRCLALAQAEAVRLLRAAGIAVARLTPLPAGWIPRLLAAPDPVFVRLGGRMLAIDPHARTSMQDDLDAGRTTEVDDLNGEVVRLAGRLDRSAPVNARLVELVRAAESGGRRGWSGPDLYDELRRAR